MGHIPGASADDIDLPDNLQALLGARIDRLDEDARRALQLASIIGRSFYYRVLQRVVGPAGVRVRLSLTL